jgi:glucose/arabinose dehydrogenase
MPNTRQTALSGIAVLVLAGCGDNAHLPASAGYGPHPTLPAPQKSLLSLVHIAPAKGWQEGQMPISAKGLTTTAFARGLDHPRWLYVLPNGDVLVAETNAPPKPDDGKGVAAWVQKQVMKLAGAGTKAPTASPCCATPTMTAVPISARSSCPT